jgi:hypothetical protein
MVFKLLDELIGFRYNFSPKEYSSYSLMQHQLYWSLLNRLAVGKDQKEARIELIFRQMDLLTYSLDSTLSIARR